PRRLQSKQSARHETRMTIAWQPSLSERYVKFDAKLTTSDQDATIAPPDGQVHNTSAPELFQWLAGQRTFFPMLRRCRAPGVFCGVSAMQAIDAGRPLRGRMLQQRGAVVFQIQWQLHL